MARKFLSFLLLALMLVTQFQFFPLYVNAKNSITSIKEKTISDFNNIEKNIDSTLDKIEKKKIRKSKERIKKKRKEIKAYIKQTKKEIQKQNNKKDIDRLSKKAAKKLQLKLISATTQYSNIEEKLDKKVKTDKKQKIKAIKALKKSLKNKKQNTYNIIIKTDLSKKEILKKYHIYDEKIKIKKLYKSGKEQYFQISFSNNSLLKEELFENIEAGELPDNLMGESIIQPEIFTIDSLQGEDISVTWGIEKYATYNHFDSLNTTKKIRIGIIDTGIDTNHFDLQSNTTAGYDFINNDSDATDDQGHGTHVAGTVAANINGSGIIGVNPFVELIPLKICDENGFCPSYAITQALAYADENNIDVINMSLGGRANPVGHAICDGINSYTKNGGIAVVAAGNSNINASEFVPGGCTQAITVGAVDQNNQKASFSNYGDVVDVVAPGVGIYSTSLNNTYKKMSGTSMAAPHITGLVSLLKQQDSNLTSSKIHELFQNNLLDNNNILNIESILENTPVDNGNTTEPSGPVTSPNEGSGNTDEILLEATVNPNMESLPKKEVQIIEPDLDFTVTTTGPVPQSIGFGDISELDIKINSEENTGKFETIPLDVPEEQKKERINNPSVQSFDENGNLVTDEIQINALENEVYTPGNGIEVGADFDWKNLPEGDFIEINNFEDNLEAKHEFEVEKLIIPNINQEYEKKLDFGENQKTEETVEINIKNYIDNVTEETKNSFPIKNITEGKVNKIISKKQINSDNITINNDSVQNVNLSVYEGKSISYYIRYARDYNFVLSEEGVVNTSKSKKRLGITGVKAGEVQIYGEDHTSSPVKKINFIITVLPIPNPIEYSITVEEFKEVDIIFSNNNNYRYVRETFGDGRAGLRQSSNSGTAKIIGDVAGTTKLIIYDSIGIKRYIINVQILPKPPIVKQISIFESKIYSTMDWRISGRYSISSPGIISIYSQYTWLYNITGVKGGKTDIYVKDNYGRITHRIEVTVIGKPTPKQYNLNLYVGQYGEIILPEEVALYDMTSTNNGVFDLRHTPTRGQLRVEGTKIFLPARREGSTIITLAEKDGQRFAKYIINVTVKLYESDYTTIVGERRDPGLSSSDSHRSSDSSVAYTSSDDVIAVKPGTTDIIASRDGRDKRLLHVTVIPVPDPVIIECETLIGDRCHASVSNGGYYYEQSSSGVGEIDTGTSSFRVRGLRPGTVNVFIKSRYGNFVTHIFKVTVRSKPLRFFECSAPLGVLCNTNWWGSDREYTYGISDSNILNLSLYRYTEGVQTYEKLQVTGKQEGVAEVYVYENGEHVVTFTITVEPPVSPILLEHGTARMGQTERVDIKILNGGGEYKQESYDSTLIGFSAGDIVNTGPGSEKLGKVTISGKLPGKTYPVLKDKYGQTASISVTVDDTILRLAYPSVEGKLQLSGSEENYEYVAIMESYQGIKTLTLDNDNVRAYLTYVDNNGEQVQVIKVIPQKTGTTVLTVTDYEDNPETVDIVVGSVSGGTDPGTGSGTTTEGFGDLVHITNIEANGVGGIKFNINGVVDEVGIEYQTLEGATEAIKLALQSDGEYVVAFTKDSAVSANNFKPYYIKGVVKVYYQEPLLISYDFILTAADFQVNSYGSYKFQEILNWIWFNKGYNEAYQTSSQKIYDVKESIDVKAQLVAYYTKLGVETGVEISGLETLGEGLGLTVAFWTGVISDNPYLTENAKAELNGELAIDTALEFPPTKLLSKFMEFGDKFVDLVKAGKKIRSELIEKLKNTKGFKKLENHFNNHGSDFLANTQEEYLQLAENFATNHNSKYLIKINKYDDSILKYNKDENIFISVDKDTLEIRTFYKPDLSEHNFKTNLDYFNAQ